MEGGGVHREDPFPFIDPDVWEWFVERGFHGPIQTLGETTADVARTFGIDEAETRIHFSYDGDQRYAIVVRIPVQEEGARRFEKMAALEEGFYERLGENLGQDAESGWLVEEVSLAFLPA